MTDTTCAECGKPMSLKDIYSDGEPFDLEALNTAGRKIMEGLAKMVTCTPCMEKLEARWSGRKQKELEERRVHLARIPQTLVGLKWEDMIQTGDRAAAISAAIRWAQAETSEAKGLYLHGPAGTGKTRLAATAAWDRLQRGHGLRWVSVAVLLARLEGSFTDEERRLALEVLTGDGALVLDDIDKVNPSESKRAQLFSAIDRRVNAGVPLLITGNLAPRKLEEKLGEALGSRITGYSLGRTFEMDGPDRRTQLELGA